MAPWYGEKVGYPSFSIVSLPFFAPLHTQHYSTTPSWFIRHIPSKDLNGLNFWHGDGGLLMLDRKMLSIAQEFSLVQQYVECRAE
jgi:hypothetical protein